MRKKIIHSLLSHEFKHNNTLKGKFIFVVAYSLKADNTTS
jgi:hypothetical protein